MPDLPSGTVTLLFTDIEGSTRLLQRLGGRYEEVLAEHHRLLRAVFQACGGLEVGTQGDAFFVAFTTATDALRAAAGGQSSLLSHHWADSEPVRIRIGIHTGEPTLVADDYVGLDVHRAARICSAAHGGQIVVSQTTRELVGDEPPDGLRFVDLGTHRLKDLQRPEHIYGVVGAGLPSDFPPLKSLETPSNLPVMPTELVGRGGQRDAVGALLTHDGVRLVTLTGPGGTGKTRLALQVAADFTRSFEDGVFFVALAPLDDASLVPATVARALDVRDSAGEIIATLEDFVADKHLLLVLDNFEHVLDAAEVVARLLVAAPRLKVLATSRAVLRLSGEHEFPVPPLSLPDVRPGADLDAIASSEAVSLFVQRAGSARHGFRLTEANARDVAEICLRLDGLPLAIELAAARVRMLSPRAILSRLGRQLELLTGGPGDVPPRQRTLRGAIDWSYNLLDEDDKSFFRAMSVFAGGCTLESVEVVVEPDAGTDVLEAMESLVDKSLIRRSDTDDEPRFSLLETMREYAGERLSSAGQEYALRRRHAEYFCSLAEEAHGHLFGPDQGPWGDRLELEHDNLRAALAWLLETGQGADELRTLALRMAGALGRFWYVRGHAIEGSAWLDAALQGAPLDAGRARARALHVLGVLLDQRNEVARARDLMEQSLELFRDLGDTTMVAGLLNSLGVVARSSGDLQRARDLLREALQLRRRQGDDAGVATTLSNLGTVTLDEGALDEAQALMEESLALDRSHGDEWGVALNTSNLAAVALERPDIGRASELWKEALAAFTALGDSDGLAESLERAAGIAGAEGDGTRAARLAGASQALRAEIGSPLSPIDVARFERYLRDARATLSPDEFRAAFDEGGQMTRQQALDYALGISPFS
jgi:predicted ATPase/class 3 adenylate cyclase